MSERTVTFNLVVDNKKAIEEMRELNDLFTTYIALARESGISPEFTNLVAKAQQARIAIDTLARSIQIYYATSGPLGWILAAGGFALSLFMMADVMEIRRPQY